MDNALPIKNCAKKKVILHIISAYGFGLVKGHIMICSTLIKNKIQTPTIFVNKNELKIDSEIVWYLDNVTLRELKMSNASIRIECFHIPMKKISISPEKLGYILLKIKEAQTIDLKSNDRIGTNSYKLIGSKNCSYNLTVSLRVEDYNVKTIETTPKKNLIINKNINDNNNHLEKVEEYTYFDENIDINLPKVDVNILEHTEYISKNIPLHEFNLYMQQKVIEELQDWKEKQIILFNEKMKIKEEELLKKFNNKWIDDRKPIDEELTNAMSKCKALVENLDNMTDMLKEREAIITAKELELICQKNSMENNSQIINNLNNTIFKLETKLNSTEQKIVFNEQLKDDIDSNNALQIQHLENTILNLKNKCEEANKSCMFYKERWITSVRRINQISTKLYKSKANDEK